MEEEAFVKKKPLWLCLHPFCILLYIKINLIWLFKKNE